MATERFTRSVNPPGTVGKQSDAHDEIRRPQGETTTRVLMIEDNAEFAAIVGQLLGELEVEFQVESAGKLGDGISSLAGGDVDVVLLDLSLPDCNGLQTLAAVRACAPLLPVIVLTGADDEELAIEAMKCGAQDYLLKTEIDGRVLGREIRYAVERNALREKLRRYATELEERNRTMESELKMARDIQRAYLPLGDANFPSRPSPQSSSLRVHSRFQPAAELGGDFFDIIEVSENEIGIFICDVMGHGLSAGLVAGVVRGLIEEARQFADDPSLFLAELNREMRTVLCRTEGPIFATAFYLIADLINEEIHYANAGHPVPMFRDQVTGEVGVLSPGFPKQGPALGLFGDAIYPTSSRPLRPNDLFILFTDGLYEATDEHGKMFGGERLANDLRVHARQTTPELFDFLLDDARAFSGRETFEDDVCLLGIQMHRAAVVDTAVASSAAA